MKGVVLAGGTGSRLLPLTKLVNKHLLPVGKYPMIHYSILKLCDAGIRDILIVTGKQSAGLFVEYLGGGESYNARLTYRVQEQPDGIAAAMAMAEGFVGQGEGFVTLLGDNLFHDGLDPFVKEFDKQPEGAMVMLKHVENPSRFGVPVFHPSQTDILQHIEEKPLSPKSTFCVTGIYFYRSDVFDVIRSLSPSHRGELEITDVNNEYARAGTLTYQILNGWWLDAGTHDSLREAGDRMRRERRR